MMVFVAIVLNPNHKLTMVEMALQAIHGKDKGEKLTQEVKAFTMMLFEEYKVKYCPSNLDNRASQSKGCSTPMGIEGNSFLMGLTQRLEEQGVSGSRFATTEFEAYLIEQRTTNIDILGWWRLNGCKYPVLAHIARDVFVIPITTVPSESAFSTGGCTLDDYRSSLTPKTVQGLICAQDWLLAKMRVRYDNDVEQEEEVYEVFGKLQKVYFGSFPLWPCDFVSSISESSFIRLLPLSFFFGEEISFSRYGVIGVLLRAGGSGRRRQIVGSRFTHFIKQNLKSTRVLVSKPQHFPLQPAPPISPFLCFSHHTVASPHRHQHHRPAIGYLQWLAMAHKDESYLNTVIDKRIKLFTTIQTKLDAEREAIAGDPIRITLPDGNVKDGKKWITTPYHVASDISKGLANNALIAQVNGVLWDMTRPLEGDCDLKLFKFDDDEGRDTFWHSSAHILGQALEQEYGCKLCIGPCTTRGEGFYYDAFYGDLGLNEDHFKQIKSKADKAVEEKQPFERIEVSRQQALEMFSDNKFKIEIIEALPEDKTITVYRCGPLVDLCRGPHIPNTSFVKAFCCLKASAAYWRGDKDRESLQRVYGISYPDSKRLKEYIRLLEEAKKYDHRLLGSKQELFFCHPLSPGSWFFLPYGTRVYNKLMDFIRGQYRERGYTEVISPNMYNMQLWETSGHAANYKENMFVFEIEKQEFGLKPMNCPGHCLMFEHRVRSYRELPLRLADFGVLHRNEASGALTGLTRVRRFQQDDAHIFCRESQIKDEVRAALEFIDHVYFIFGFTYDLKLSTRPEKYLGDLETWDRAEKALTEALDEFGKPWQINEADGAFYGPKIDISVSDALKRKFQCATLQLDFQLPTRFNLTYSAEDEAKRERPVMIHRAVLGSVERMFAILLEHYKGKWPFWLSPRQAIVCPVSVKSNTYALEVQDKIHRAGYHVDIDLSDRTMNKKVREAQLAQYNYIIVVGETDAQNTTVTVRQRDKQDQKDLQVMSIEHLLDHFKEEAAAFH